MTAPGTLWGFPANSENRDTRMDESSIPTNGQLGHSANLQIANSQGIAPVKKIVTRQLIFDEFLWEHLHHPHMHPGSTLTLYHPEDHDCQTPHKLECFFGSIFFDGEHFYRIGDYVAEVDSWWAQWPD